MAKKCGIVNVPQDHRKIWDCVQHFCDAGYPFEVIVFCSIFSDHRNNTFDFATSASHLPSLALVNRTFNPFGSSIRFHSQPNRMTPLRGVADDLRGTRKRAFLTAAQCLSLFSLKVSTVRSIVLALSSDKLEQCPSLFLVYGSPISGKSANFSEWGLTFRHRQK